jgi:hypothetical protein
LNCLPIGLKHSCRILMKLIVIRFILCFVLKDIEDIKKWGIEVENKTQLLENYIDFGNYA